MKVAWMAQDLVTPSISIDDQYAKLVANRNGSIVLNRDRAAQKVTAKITAR
jgi:hypothetical protein